MRECVATLQCQMASRLKAFAQRANIKFSSFGFYKRSVIRLSLQWATSEWHRVAKEVSEHDENVILIHQARWIGRALHGWSSWLSKRRKFRVISGRLAKRMHFAARKRLQAWHTLAWQMGRLRVAAAKIQRHRDVMALRHAINFMLHQPDIAWRMGQTAKSRFVNLFTSEKMCQGYRDIYKDAYNNFHGQI